MKYWSISNSVDSLPFIAYAPTREAAIRIVEQLVGPMNPSRVIAKELPECPEEYQPPSAFQDAQILEELME